MFTIQVCQSESKVLPMPTKVYNKDQKQLAIADAKALSRMFRNVVVTVYDGELSDVDQGEVISVGKCCACGQSVSRADGEATWTLANAVAAAQMVKTPPIPCTSCGTNLLEANGAVKDGDEHLCLSCAGEQ